MVLALLAITPLLACWAACFWLARELAARGRIDSDWRLSWAWASLGLGAVLTTIVETASVARMLTLPVVLGGWLLADALLLAEVYPAGEAPIVAADGRALARAVRVQGKVEPIFAETIAAMPAAIRAAARDGDVVLTMGAGSISTVPGALLRGEE